MHDVSTIIDDAKNQLCRKEQLSNIACRHMCDRYFSVLYEINALKAGTPYSYILKISTTHRTCENEYNQYVYLNQLGINSLKPILYSNKYNYLITKKEEVLPFDEHLKKHKSIETRLDDFYRLGCLFKAIHNKTGEVTYFEKKKFDEYAVPRLMKLHCLSDDEKHHAAKLITANTTKLNGRETMTCLVSDFTLGNIHINCADEFVLLDMGDAFMGDYYDNIAYIYLDIRFGSLNQHIQNTRHTERYFAKFIEGTGIQYIEETEFSLFRIKHLINMIAFVTDNISTSNNYIKLARSFASNKYLVNKYRKYLFTVLSKL